jgi:hypothetical protein
MVEESEDAELFGDALDADRGCTEIVSGRGERLSQLSHRRLRMRARPMGLATPIQRRAPGPSRAPGRLRPRQKAT